jgi:nucleoside 2-deoxyribosyltransferase
VWNATCAAALRDKGYVVVLPQEEAKYLTTSAGKTDLGLVAERCYEQSIRCDVMIVVLDGADSDSGASLEAGLKIGYYRAAGSGGKVIGLRTDFRTSEDDQLNAMFRLLDEIIYLPSHANEDPGAVCDKLDDAIRKLSR